MRRDYYAVLGISATAGDRELRQAYRRLARQYSPDVNFWDEEARGLFAEIAEAYRVLSDPAARAMYDRFGPRFHGGVLEAGRRGEDVHVTVELSFADVARGLTLPVEVVRYSPCGACGASGRRGEGVCGVCAGRGVRRAVDRLGVAIPAGVDTGSQLRVPGEGSAGPFGGPRGDLLVITRVREHPFFHRRGDGVHCEVSISVWEALRGARITVPTPTGAAALVVPPGTRPGHVVRLRGQGLPKLAGGGVGDLAVTIRVEMPEGLDTSTDELVRQLERLVPMMPRAGLDRYAHGAE
jgi:DnaJ-class molecular chaperone